MPSKTRPDGSGTEEAPMFILMESVLDPPFKVQVYDPIVSPRL